MNEAFKRLILQIEHAIDVHSSLTRLRPSGCMNHASLACEVTVDGELVWEARCSVRSLNAKGRGARDFHGIHASGPTPEAATEALLASLDSWAEGLS